MFVGDSLNRNMWESLVCALRESLKNKGRLYEVSSRRHLRSQGFFSFKFRVIHLKLLSSVCLPFIDWLCDYLFVHNAAGL